MEDKYVFYYNRTLKHIHRVQRNAFYLITHFGEVLNKNGISCQELARNVLTHDISKFSDEQFSAYVEFSWYMKHKEDLAYTMSKRIQDAFNLAWKNHYETENHHPEKLLGKCMKMSNVQIAEIVCDLQAMAQEFNEGTCEKYFENKWIKNQSKNFYDDYDWERVQVLMRKLIKCFKVSKTN